MGGFEILICIAVSGFLIAQAVKTREPYLLFLFSIFCFLDGLGDISHPHRISEVPYAFIFSIILGSVGFLLSRKYKSPTIKG